MVRHFCAFSPFWISRIPHLLFLSCSNFIPAVKPLEISASVSLGFSLLISRLLLLLYYSQKKQCW